MEECWFWLDACFYLYFYLIILINNNGYPFSLLLGFRHSDTFPFPREKYHMCLQTTAEEEDKWGTVVRTDHQFFQEFVDDNENTKSLAEATNG